MIFPREVHFVKTFLDKMYLKGYNRCMKLSDKVMIIMGCIATLLVMWHVFAPKEMQIEGFYGYPLYFCMFLMGYGIACGSYD